MPFVNVPNGRLHYEIHGQGRALVFLHGLWSNRGLWRETFPDIAASNEVILVDLMGHGLSDRMQVPYRPDTYASDLGHLLDSLQRNRVTLLGFSLGATIAQAYSFRRPSAVEALVLIATPPPYRLRWMIGIEFVWFLQRLGITSLKKETLKALGRRYSKGTDKGFIEKTLRDLSSLDDDAFALLLRSAWDRKYIGRGRGLRIPTCIVVGEADPIRSHSVALQQAIAGSRLSVLPGCNHAVLFDRPDWITREILSFLDSLPPGP